MPYVPSFPFRALRPEPSRDPWRLISDTQVIEHTPGIITVKPFAEETLAETEAQLKVADAELLKRVASHEQLSKTVLRRFVPGAHNKEGRELSYMELLSYEVGRREEHKAWVRYYWLRERAVRELDIGPPPAP